MVRISLLVAGMMIALLSTMLAGEKTWSNSIAKTVYSKCSSCHRDGGIAPFSLMNYEQVVNRKESMLEAVQSKKMPPYPADTKFRSYSHQRDLTDEQIADIQSWIQSGAPLGNPDEVPLPPSFANSSHLENPDYSAQMPVYTSNAVSGGEDVYRCFVLDGSPKKDEYISALEVIPGNIGIVHHVLIFQDTSSVPLNLDNASPEPGYTSFGGIGSTSAQLIGVYAPGNEPYSFPKGFGIKFMKNARIIIQVHYPEGTAGEQDSTQIRFLYSKDAVTREVFIDPLLNHKNIIDGPFRIPANQVKTFHQRYTIPVDASVLAVMPHMHLLGESTKIIVHTPNKDTIPIVSIPEWDFHWQMAYTFTTLQKVTKGSTLESTVIYDNTINNPHNPSNPPKVVSLGEGTTDEMMLTYFYYTLYKPGDETIVTGIADDNNERVPIKVSHIHTYVKGDRIILELPAQHDYMDIAILDLSGRIIQRLAMHNDDSVVLPIMLSGIYFIQAIGNDGRIIRGTFIQP